MICEWNQMTQRTKVTEKGSYSVLVTLCFASKGHQGNYKHDPTMALDIPKVSGDILFLSNWKKWENVHFSRNQPLITESIKVQNQYFHQKYFHVQICQKNKLYDKANFLLAMSKKHFWLNFSLFLECFILLPIHVKNWVTYAYLL